MEKIEGVGVKRGAWTHEEDTLLRNCIRKFGAGRWHLVPLRAGLNRCRKSCRLRWLNYLNPELKRGHFSQDEVDLMHRLHKLLGNRWSLIAGRLPGRSANDVKNFWNTHISKKLPPADDKSPRQTITGSNIIRPKPRTLSKSRQLAARSSQVEKSKPLRNDEENKAPTKKQVSVQSSSSSLLSLQKANDRNENIPVNALLEDIDLHECSQWCENLLKMTEEGGKETPFWVSGDEQGITAPVFEEDRAWDWVWSLNN